jgi:L-amino acid N-acyltransferase YncA
MMNKKTELPRQVDLDGDVCTLRLMTSLDGPVMMDFAKRLPPHDLLFLRRDITNSKVVSAWAEAVKEGTIESVVATDDNAVLGCAAVIRDPFSWSPHLGEIRLLVAEGARQKGLGRVLLQDAFRMALERDLKKLTAQMTVDQKGAIAIFEELGFRGEALLKDHVIDGKGVSHDIVILSCDVERASSQLAAYGVDDPG